MQGFNFQSSADLWKTQSDLLHRQLSHILFIRGWAASLTAGLATALATSHEPLIGLGGIVLIAFWYTDHVYGKFSDLYASRESALRQSLSRNVSDPGVAKALAAEVKYRRGAPRIISYASMLAVLAATSLYLMLAR